MGMNVLVTSGGTIEKIDSVRNISNVSTGKLCSLVADRFADEPGVEKIYYVCSSTAIRPQSDKVEAITADSVADLESAVRSTLGRASVDVIVHGMAVSDYRVRAVTTMENIAGLIAGYIAQRGEARAPYQDTAAEAAGIVALLKDPGSVISADGKISSDVDDLLLFMERTPKIIPLFQSLAPKATLVGFKLLDGVPLDTLIDRGFEILVKNKCSFVLANDLRDVSGDRHIGYLIDDEKNYVRYESKMEIAAAIVSATMSERVRRS